MRIYGGTTLVFGLTFSIASSVKGVSPLSTKTVCEIHRKSPARNMCVLTATCALRVRAECEQMRRKRRRERKRNSTAFLYG